MRLADLTGRPVRRCEPERRRTLPGLYPTTRERVGMTSLPPAEDPPRPQHAPAADLIGPKPTRTSARLPPIQVPTSVSPLSSVRSETGRGYGSRSPPLFALVIADPSGLPWPPPGHRRTGLHLRTRRIFLGSAFGRRQNVREAGLGGFLIGDTNAFSTSDV